MRVGVQAITFLCFLLPGTGVPLRIVYYCKQSSEDIFFGAQKLKIHFYRFSEGFGVKVGITLGGEVSVKS